MPSSKALNLRLLHLKWSVADSTWLTQQASLRCVSVCVFLCRLPPLHSEFKLKVRSWISVRGNFYTFTLLGGFFQDLNCSDNRVWILILRSVQILFEVLQSQEEKKKQGSNESLERINERVFFSLKHNSFCQGVPEEGTYCEAPWVDGSSQVWMGKQLKLSLKPVIVWKGGVGGRRPPFPGCEGTALAWLARRLCGWGFLR